MRRSARLRYALLTTLSDIGQNCTVLTSAGVDSASIVTALMLLGRKPTVASFTLDDRQSSDFMGARRLARAAGLAFVPLILPTKLDQIKLDCRSLIQEYGLQRKTSIEYGWPMLKIMRSITDESILVGSFADALFGTSKKAMIHFSGDVSADNFDAHRLRLMADTSYAQTDFVLRVARDLGKTLCIPYRDYGTSRAFLGATIREINRPRQKQLTRDAFPEMEAWFPWLKRTRNTPYQLGDSGIAALFQTLLTTAWNPGGRYVSVVGVYNHMVRRHAMPTLVIGQAPSRCGDPNQPLMGAFGERVSDLAGVRFPDEYRDVFSRTNILQKWPGSRGSKGDAFPMTAARRAAVAMAEDVVGRRVIFAGASVARAFGVSAELLVWSINPDYDFAVMPHPSGVNRQWNDPANAARVQRFLRTEVKRMNERRVKG